MPTVTSGARSHVGLVRAHNEDAVLSGRNVWAVADGMGGHAAGEVASALVVAALARLDGLERLRVGDVVATLAEAHSDVLRHGDLHPGARGLGSTVTGVARVVEADAERWLVFNVGDSRVYRVGEGGLTRATVDHSETEDLVRAGIITAGAARTHPARHVITRSLGQPAPLEVDTWLVDVAPGERFLVCSDGLTGEVSDGDLERLLRSEPDAGRAASALVDAALAGGGRDNVTALVVDVSGPDAAASGPQA